MLLGKILQSQGRPEEAIETYRKAQQSLTLVAAELGVDGSTTFRH